MAFWLFHRLMVCFISYIAWFCLGMLCIFVCVCLYIWLHPLGSNKNSDDGKWLDSWWHKIITNENVLFSLFLSHVFSPYTHFSVSASCQEVCHISISLVFLSVMIVFKLAPLTVLMHFVISFKLHWFMWHGRFSFVYVCWSQQRFIFVHLFGTA